jgi:uncharacterized protein YjbI with pentapeptide repeats
MKPAVQRGVQPPQLPKSLPSIAVERLADHQEVAAGRLSGSDFTDQTARDIVFEQVQVRRAAFTRTHLTNVRLTDVYMEVVELSGAVWEQARIRRVAFGGCRLLGIQLVKAQLEDVLFQECNLEGAVLAAATCRAVRFERCNLRGAALEEADLTGAVFAGCDLTNADLRDATLRNADLRGATLDGLRITVKALQGAIIAPGQAAQIVGLLGVTVREDEGRS